MTSSNAARDFFAVRDAQTPPAQTPTPDTTNDHDNSLERRSLPAPTPSPLSVVGESDVTNGSSPPVSDPELNAATDPDLVKDRDELRARLTARIIHGARAEESNVRSTSLWIAQQHNRRTDVDASYQLQDPDQNDSTKDIDIPAVSVKIRNDLNDWLTVDDRADNLSIKPMAEMLKVGHHESAYENNIPVEYRELVNHRCPVQEERIPFHDPDNQKPWYPVLDTTLKEAHLQRARKLRREEQERCDLAPNDFDAVYRAEASLPNEDHTDDSLEPSWKHAAWDGRLMDGFKKQMDTWDKRNKAQQAANVPSFVELTLLEQDAVEGLATLTKPHTLAEVYNCSGVLIEQISASMADEGAELARQKAEEQSPNCILQLDGEPLDPLLRISRHPDDREALKKERRKNWATRGEPADEKLKADQQKVARLATLLWEEVEQKPSNMTASDLTEPLWTRMTMTGIADNDHSERGVWPDDHYTRFEKSLDVDKYGNETRKLERARLVRQDEWLEFTRRWTGDKPAKALAANEEYEWLAWDFKPSDDMWLEPDHPQGVFDVDENEYYAERLRQAEVKKKRSVGKTKDELEAWHQNRFGTTIAEKDDQAKQVKERMILKRKLLPLAISKLVKPPTMRKRKAPAAGLEDPSVPVRKSARVSARSRKKGDTISSEEDSPTTEDNTANPVDSPFPDAEPATLPVQAREMIVDTSSPEQSPLMYDDAVLQEQSPIIENESAVGESLIVKLRVNRRILNSIVTGAIHIGARKTSDLWGF